MNIAPILAVSDALDPTAGGLIPGDVAEVHPLLVDPHRPIADHELLETFGRDLFAPQGLPTGRLVLRDHLWAVRTTDDRWWLVVDYAVPGSIATVRDDAGELVRTTYDVRLNHETSRVPDGQPGAWDAALDRAVVELGPPLPVWVIFAPPTPD